MKPAFLFKLFGVATVIRLCALSVHALETTYWVWNRKTPLTQEETQILLEQGVRKLYWNAETLYADAGFWRLKAPLRIPVRNDAGLVFAPVLRLSLDGGLPLGSAAADSVSRLLLEAAHRVGSDEAQIDFDCPDRLLGEYAKFLGQCRMRMAPLRLSATALAGWSRTPEFSKLQRAVDLLMPMFYDVAPDEPTRVQAGGVLPLIDSTTLALQIKSWRSCRTPWFAGLPNFARITIFDQHGRSRGHLREWEWDAICFSPALVLRTRPALGVTLLRAESDAVLGSTLVTVNETVACKRADLGQLAAALALVEKSGASGVSLFRLPGAGAQSGWSLAQMTTLLRSRQAGEADFQLRRGAQSLELRNVSASDLPPRLSGDGGERDRGWQLEVESTAGAIFREASPGEFAAVFGHAEPDAPAPRRVRIPLAQRLTYWFAEMRAGQSRVTGLLQLAAGNDTASFRWRIPGSPRNSEWQTLE